MRLYFETQKIEIVMFQFFFIEFAFFYRRNVVEKTTFSSFFISFFKYFVRCLKPTSFFFSKILVFDFIFFFVFIFAIIFVFVFVFFFVVVFFSSSFFFSFSFQFFASQTKTKFNELINMKKLVINMMKSSSKTRKKRKIKKRSNQLKIAMKNVHLTLDLLDRLFSTFLLY